MRACTDYEVIWHQDQAVGKGIGRYFETLILEMADLRFHFDDLEVCHITD